jgi:hypothetical protein
MSYATDRLIKNARNALPGSLDSAILLEFYNVLDRFFRDSSIWIEDVPFDVNATDPAGTIYYIEPESVSVIVRLMGVVNADGIRRSNVVMDTPGEITLLTPPGNAETYAATVALSIIDPVQRDGYPEFPEWILQQFGLGLLHGVIANMMAQPAKPYSNVQLAPAHGKIYRTAVSQAGTFALHRNVHNAQTWMFPQQFSTRRW